MNKNILLFFILFIFVTATSLVIIFKPKTHKPIAFENRNFKLELISQSVQVDIPKTEVNVEIKVPEVKIETPAVSVKAETPNIKTQKSTPKAVPNSTKTTQSSKQTLPKKNSNKTVNTKSETSPPKEKETKTNNVVQPSAQNQPKNPEKADEAPKVVTKPNVQNVPETKPASSAQKQLTEEELEIIAWNKWRSDLQNQLMRDSKISAPIGTRFMFSFTVDKFGTITNLKTWSSNPSYTPTAVRVIKPILLGYQGKAILNFPTNSKRITTNVEGGFTMAYTSNYSKPSDYNDYERIKK